MKQIFEKLTEPFISRGGQRSTMMGFPCVRRNGVFFASFDKDSLILKLSQERIISLLSEGQGAPFSPNGKRFREWISISAKNETVCQSLLEEAWQFAAKEKP